jgi:adenylate cyclase
VGDILTDLAEQEGDTALLMQASLARGHLSYYLGELRSAQENLEQVLALYDLDQHRSHSFLFGRDPGVASQSLLSQVLWYLGYPDQALETLREGLALARETDHPYSLAYGLVSAAILYTLRREWEAVDKHAEATINLSEKMGFKLWLAAGRFHKGLALTKNGQVGQGIELMEQGLMAWQKGRAELGVRHWPGLLSEAHAKAGNVGKGLNIIDEAIAEAEKTRENVCKAELWRVKGDLLRMQGNGERKARESFHRSIRIARAQKAMSWELRAVISLSRLMGELGNREAARGMLERIYAQFDEGLETKDLKEANDLLIPIALSKAA